MADKYYMFFTCRLTDRWRSITCISEMVLVLKTLVKNQYLKVKNDQKCPNKMIDCCGGRFRNSIQGLKVASYI